MKRILLLSAVLSLASCGGGAPSTGNSYAEDRAAIIELQKAYRKGELWAESKRRFASWWKELGR